jgi:hypothetical protein
MPHIIPTTALTLDQVPLPDCSNGEIIRFAQTLNGYEQVGGPAANLGAYIKPFRDRPIESLSLEDLRILLFARQRAHYHQGGGWPDGDPIMDEMRGLTLQIRSRLEQQA